MGFIALYPRGTPYRIEYGYWSKNVPGPLLGASLNLGVDGRLYLANGNNTNIISTAVNSTTGRVLYRLRMDSDGFLRLYSHNRDPNGAWSVIWSPSGLDRCTPMGICGLNAYCIVLMKVMTAHVFLDLNLLTRTKLLQDVQGISA
jgi:hypothetical protein